MSRIAVIGAGAWGTAIAIVLGRSHRHEVKLWAFEKQVRDSIDTTRMNSVFLPGERIPDSVKSTGDFADALEAVEIAVTAMPSQHCRALFEQMVPHLRPGALIVSATKGLEQTTLLRMSEVICQVAGERRTECHVGSDERTHFRRRGSAG